MHLFCRRSLSSSCVSRRRLSKGCTSAAGNASASLDQAGQQPTCLHSPAVLCRSLQPLHKLMCLQQKSQSLVCSLWALCMNHRGNSSAKQSCRLGFYKAGRSGRCHQSKVQQYAAYIQTYVCLYKLTAVGHGSLTCPASVKDCKPRLATEAVAIEGHANLCVLLFLSFASGEWKLFVCCMAI